MSKKQRDKRRAEAATLERYSEALAELTLELLRAEGYELTLDHDEATLTAADIESAVRTACSHQALLLDGDED